MAGSVCGFLCECGCGQACACGVAPDAEQLAADEHTRAQLRSEYISTGNGQRQKMLRGKLEAIDRRSRAAHDAAAGPPRATSHPAVGIQLCGLDGCALALGHHGTTVHQALEEEPLEQEAVPC